MKKAIPIFNFLFTLLMVTLLVACNQHYVPKPRGYVRIELPTPKYQLTADTLPYSLQYSAHAVASPDTFRITEPYWTTVYYPQFKAEIQITYKYLNNDTTRLYELIDDSHFLKNRHQIRAYNMQQYTLKSESGINATLFTIDGQVPSQVQFFATDTTKHFLRAALYFPTSTKNDSLKPVIQYITNDLVHMIKTLKWNNDFKFPENYLINYSGNKIKKG